MKIAALIITLNEEYILPKSLSKLSFVDEIVIIDSFSDDNTVKIAKSFGAKIFQREFDNYANQRNFALDQINDNIDWILMIDADEIVEENLRDEIKNNILQTEISMFCIRRKDFFNGKWLRFSTGYPTWFPRLFKRGTVQVKREINEEYISTGKRGFLNEHLFHYPFNKGIDWWFTRHNKYSTMESIKMKTEIQSKINFKDIFSSDPILRRKSVKRLSYRIPFRPTIIFLILYIFKGGFLDGKNGYDYCRMRKLYETLIDLKFRQN